MIENRHNVLTAFETTQHGGAEPAWFAAEPTAKPARVRGMRILLVEDEEPLRACLRMMLEFEGHQVIEATNGAEGLSLFTTGKYDLVITDFEMPVMAGNALALGIKSLDPSIPILMISASERARRELRNPIDALLNKPFTVTELHGALQNLFSGHPEPAQPVVSQDDWETHLETDFVALPS
jgi:DNA-binding response OmpR family regulator